MSDLPGDYMVSFRISSSEKKRLKREAANNGMTISEYARYQLFGTEVQTPLRELATRVGALEEQVAEAKRFLNDG